MGREEKKVKVRLANHKSVAGPNGSARGGQVIELPVNEAKAIVESGGGEYLDAPAKAKRGPEENAALGPSETPETTPVV